MYRILRDTLRVGIITEAPPASDDCLRNQSQRLEAAAIKRFGHSLAIRHVDAGSCNGCELEIHALNNPYYMLEGLGFRFVASPRHADLLLVTGPVSRHMETALKRTYTAMPDPKLVLAVGDCGRDGGIFGCSYASLGGVSAVIPVDVVVPGCPPSPMALLQGLITAVTAEDLLTTSR
ncbi:MAG: NADH-quinone oxidoreductase subunit B family protein [Gammaproteobacteria bacterium]